MIPEIKCRISIDGYIEYYTQKYSVSHPVSQAFLLSAISCDPKMVSSSTQQQYPRTIGTKNVTFSVDKQCFS